MSWLPLAIEECQPDERYLKRGVPRLICQGITSLRNHAFQFAQGIFLTGNTELGKSLAEAVVDYVVKRTGMDRNCAHSMIFSEMAATVRDISVQAALARASEMQPSRKRRGRR